VIHYAPKAAKYLSLTTYFPKSDIEGTVELAMIASSHVIFCLLLLAMMPIHLPIAAINWHVIPLYFFYGILLGIGCMGVSGLLCKIIIQIIKTLKLDDNYDLKTWLTVGRGGWIKHHLQSIEILPVYLSLSILAMQVGSEEIIFRSIFINYFIPFGGQAALWTAVSLFVLMQAFLMNCWQSAIFPMIGAAVMGVVHSILYLQVPVIWPLIIAHITFFIFSVI